MSRGREDAPASRARTIAAIASPAGPGARGVIRVSGPRAAELVRATTDAIELSSRTIAAARFHDGRGTQPVLVLWMPGPRSFTREDVAEFHLPGSPPLLARALQRLIDLGAAPAEPGEFTRRAFLSGRIDLTRAEGVLALVVAHNESQARAARSLLFGGLESRVAAARDALVDARTLCEASLDFDENDTGHVPRDEIAALLARARERLDDAAGFESARTAPSDAPRFVLAGAPNAGKSALFNALAEDGSALVSPRAGTTRDVLESTLRLEGASVRLLDTAGLDTATSDNERAAQARSRAALESADFVVWVVDASTASREALARASSELGASPRHLAWNKVDLAPAPPPEWTRELGVESCTPVSARTGVGIEALRTALARAVTAARAASGLERETAQRHRATLAAARIEVDAAGRALAGGDALELAAEHLRLATEALDGVSGATTAEDVLDRIFARFCLGK